MPVKPDSDKLLPLTKSTLPCDRGLADTDGGVPFSNPDPAAEAHPVQISLPPVTSGDSTTTIGDCAE
jgi:hypothetical protein